MTRRTRTSEQGELPVEGVSSLDHTADIGLEITAPTLPELFRRAALGAMWMVLERAPDTGAGREARSVELVEEELPYLLRSWLRLLLGWQESEGFVAMDPVLVIFPEPLCASPDGQAFGLRGRVEGAFDSGTVVREIKGVTLHELRVEQRDGQWYGRVILDV